ncbi:hypothetical protein ACFQMA_07205 [Halosimplex aquaticum]|uniref:Uncharacterized protein n=1 Tax=Halosimplex aquaticum TaxID=3026162 RepID=A0ABD5Y1N2_9EURY|nr:hypothetical protein [Halosimplex aquaticum]
MTDGETDRAIGGGDRSPRELSRRAALGALAAPVAVGGCLGLGGGGRDTVVLTGVQLYNWTSESIEVELTLSIDGSEAFATTTTVASDDTAGIARDWSGEPGSYRLQASVADGSLGVDATLPDGGWRRGRCAWAEVDFGSDRQAREVGGATDTPSAGARLRENDEGPFQSQCPAE